MSENTNEKPDLATFKTAEDGRLLCKLQRTGVLEIELPGGCMVIVAVPKVDDSYEGRVEVRVGGGSNEFSIGAGASLIPCFELPATSESPPAPPVAKTVHPKPKPKPKKTKKNGSEKPK